MPVARTTAGASRSEQRSGQQVRTIGTGATLSVARQTELQVVYDYLASRIDDVCERSVFLDAFSNSLAVAWRLGPVSPQREPGYLVTLPLTSEGVERLRAGRAIGRAPLAGLIARTHKDLAAVYVWALASEPSSFSGVLRLLELYSSNEMRSVPIYCRPTSQRNRSLFERIGFEAVGSPNDQDGPMVINHTSTPDNDQTGGPTLEISPCRTLDDFQQVIAIRSVAYMAEQGCPYEEEFDGNDFGATHLIGRIDGRPAACIRMRYFADFAKIERLAVLPQFRRGAVGIEIASAAVEYCRRKGYTTFYGHSADKIAPLWERIGFRHRSEAESFEFSGVTYREMIMETERRSDAVDLDSGPLVIVRPEGDWDRPGILERPTRPVESAEAA